MKFSKIAAAALAATFLSSGVALAGDGPWQVRVRAIVVAPDESSTITPIGGQSNHDTSIVPELDISYFFNEKVSAELILGVTNHNAVVEGSTLGDVDMGDVWLLPPTLTLQYHFAPDAVINPYIGAGVNYTIFFSEGGLPAGSPIVNIGHSNSFGPALQAGFDVDINEDWFFNVDVKKVWIDTKATVNAGALGTVIGQVNLDPWIIGVGFGKRF